MTGIECSGDNLFGAAPVGTRFIPVGLLGWGSYAATEANAQVSRKTAGTFANMFLNSGANTSSLTVTLRINGISGNSSISVLASAGGMFSDPTGSDTVSAGDLVNYQIVVVGSLGRDINCLGIVFDAANSTVSIRMGCWGGETAQSITATTPLYMTPVGNLNNSATLANGQFYSKNSSLVSNLFVSILTNTRTQAVTYGMNVNSVEGSMSVSISAGSTGVFEDLVGTVSLSFGDLYALSLTPGSDVGNSIVCMAIFFDWTSFDSTVLAQTAIAGVNVGVNFTTLTYAPFYGLPQVSGNKAAFRFLQPFEAMLSHADILITNNTLTLANTVAVGLNDIQKLVIGIPGLTTGRFINNADTAHMSKNDKPTWIFPSRVGSGTSTDGSQWGVLQSLLFPIPQTGIVCVASDDQWLGGDEY